MAHTTTRYAATVAGWFRRGSISFLAANFLLFGFSLAAQAGKKGSAPPRGAPAKAAKAPPVAIIHTTIGDMKCTLFPDKSPKAVSMFIGLAKGTKSWKNPVTSKPMYGKPLYDGVIFHRVIPDFAIFAGDPTGTGNGDVGFEISDKLEPDLLFDQPGRLALANRAAAPATSSSQFFITEKALSFLDPCLNEGGCPQVNRPKGTGYIIFGQCDDSTVEMVKRIARMPCAGGPTCGQSNSRPLTPVKIVHIEIQSGGATVAKKPPNIKLVNPPKPAPTKSAPPKN
ncbi:MAG TPA: peptidylprolyl isomerase [Candidatus Angelobacter sp.]|nr:peptidylprolyl isomerase [Candidatus Angelobacter sp.]